MRRSLGFFSWSEMTSEGTFDPRKSVVKGVNGMALLMGVISLVTCPLYWVFFHSAFLLIASLLVSLIMLLVRFLNGSQKHRAAELILYLALVIEPLIAYWKLGNAAHPELGILFSLGVAYYVFSKRTQRAVCLVLTIVLIALLEINSASHSETFKSLSAIRFLKLSKDLSSILLFALLFFLTASDNSMFEIWMKSQTSLKTELENLLNENLKKSHFIKIAYHEIRNQVAALVKIGSGLKRTRDQQERDYLLTIMCNASNDMALIASNVLEYGKHEDGKLFNPKYERVDVRHFLNKTAEIYSLVAKEKNLTLEHTVQSNFPSTILTDRGKILQIVNNLLSNAIKYSFEGGVIYLELVTQEESWQIIVSDQGKGIPKNMLNQIFNGSESTFHTSLDGLGIGLNISSKLAEALDGKIHVTSELKKGSTFTVTIPKKHSQKIDEPFLNVSSKN